MLPIRLPAKRERDLVFNSAIGPTVADRNWQNPRHFIEWDRVAFKLANCSNVYRVGAGWQTTALVFKPATPPPEGIEESSNSCGRIRLTIPHAMDSMRPKGGGLLLR